MRTQFHSASAPTTVRRFRVRALAMLALGTVVTGCSLDSLLRGSDLPSDVVDPGAYKTESGSISLYQHAHIALERALGVMGGFGRPASYVNAAAILSDEVQYLVPSTTAYPNDPSAYIDARQLPQNDFSTSGIALSSSAHDVFAALHNVRIAAREAEGAIAKYGPNLPRALRGHMYAFEAFAQILLSELYCSGIPLTTLEFETGYTQTRGFSTEEVLKRAVRLLDTALVLSADSARIQHFARIVQGRAYLNLGYYDSAALAVRDVPSEYTYTIQYMYGSTVFTWSLDATEEAWDARTMGDRKGTTGLPYVSSGDPRTRAIQLQPGIMFPAKFGGWGNDKLIIASGIEAQLMIAEHELSKGNTGEWLNILNRLRTTGAFTIQPRPGDAGMVDTAWVPGSGRVLFPNQATPLPGIRPLTDPGNPTDRVSLQFEERAYWLYLTGHRQGDMRRLVRQYRRLESQVYPSGKWGPLALANYGADVNLPTPVQEQMTNKLYTGCINRDA